MSPTIEAYRIISAACRHGASPTTAAPITCWAWTMTPSTLTFWAAQQTGAYTGVPRLPGVRYPLALPGGTRTYLSPCETPEREGGIESTVISAMNKDFDGGSYPPPARVFGQVIETLLMPKMMSSQRCP
jgi:hypothetical protein